MATSINPMAGYVVVQAEKAAAKTKSGLYIPESAQEKPKTAKIVAVGPAAKQVKVGSRVVYKSYSTTEVKVEGTNYILVKEEDILATVK